MDVKADSNLPVVKQSEQWKIELLEPSKGKSFAQGKKGDHEVYSLLVTNIEKKAAYNVYVGAFRNEQNSEKKYGLAPQMYGNKVDSEEHFSFRNFPVKTGTDQLHLVITWEDEPVAMSNGEKTNGRKYIEEVNIPLPK